jgi:hypothetical protein
VPVLVLTRPGEQAPRFEPAVVRVTLQARQDQLRSLEPDAVRAYIELRDGDVLPGRAVPIRILAPAGVRATEIQPATARIGLPAGGVEDDAR